jgi:hypothetical protein
MSAERQRTKADETISDHEIRLAIRYLDPNIKREASDIAVVITLLALFLIVGIVRALVHLRGL